MLFKILFAQAMLLQKTKNYYYYFDVSLTTNKLASKNRHFLNEIIFLQVKYYIMLFAQASLKYQCALKKLRLESQYIIRDMTNEAVKYTYRLTEFRKEIRKNELEEIFNRERKKFTIWNFPDNQILSSSEISAQLTNLYQDLIKYVQEQSYEQFISNKIKHYSVDWLCQFMSRDVSYQLQYMATSILTEYYFYNELQIPSQSNLRRIVHCLFQSQNEILKNCMIILDNILYNHVEIKKILVQRFSIVESITQKIEKYKNQQRILRILLKIVYRLLNSTIYHHAYSQLLYPMTSFILSLDDQSTPFTKDINLLVIYNFHMLVKLSPQVNQLIKQIVQLKIITKLIRLLQRSEYSERRQLFVILDLIQICRQSLKLEYIQEQILPFILSLRDINFIYGSRTSIFTNQSLKIKAYNYLLYLAQTQVEIAQKIFLQKNYFPIQDFIQQARQEQNPKIAEILMKIIYCLSFCIKKENNSSLLATNLEKGNLQINENRYEFQNYFEENNYYTDSL